jgi:hypothetical protein
MIRPRPQRPFPPSPPGVLLKRTGAAASPQPPRNPRAPEDAGYLAKIRQLPCLYCGVEPCGEAAHVKFSSALFAKTNSLGKRPHDRDAVPLCRDCHLDARHAQHKGSEEAFWARLGISPYLVASRLYAQRGDMVAMRAVVFVAIAERSKAQ